MTSGNAREAPAMRTGGEGERGWSFVSDGPPLIAVAPVFLVLLAVWLPERLMGPEIVGFLAVAVIGALIQIQTWPWIASADQTYAAASIGSLGQRLRQARADRLERDRYR